MARVNTALMWATIGSVYQLVFDQDAKRPIEAAWQMMAQLAADGLERVREATLQRAIFETAWDEFWGLQPLDITRADVSEVVSVIGARLVSGRWQMLVEPPAGAQVFANGVVAWPDGQRQDFFGLTVLPSGLWLLSLLEPPKGDAGGSYFFGAGVDLTNLALLGSRPMTAVARGLRFYLEGLNLSIITNKIESSGTTTLVEIGWVITDFVPGNALSKKVARMSIFSASSALALVLRYEDGLYFEWTDGVTTTALTPAGDVAALEAALSAANEINGVQMRFSISINLVASEAELIIAAGNVSSTATVPWAPDGIYTSFDVLDQLGVFGGYVEYMRIEEGDARATLSDGYGARYLVNPPIHDASRIFAAPMRVGLVGYVEVSGNGQARILVDEETTWAPPVAVLAQGDDVFEARLISNQGGVVIYEALRDFNQSMPQLGDVVIEPWYLQEDEWWFTDPGVLRSERELPDVKLWARDSRATGVDLYGRWGRVLSAPALPDSPEYLNLLRGLYLGLHAPPTPSNLASAIAWTRGVPATREAARIESTDVVRDALGRPLSININFEGEVTINVPYSLRHLVLPPGTELEAWQQPIRGVTVVDALTSPDRIAAVQPNVWARPHTFLVTIPGDIGASIDSMAVIKDLVSRSKPTHTLGLFEVSATGGVEDLLGLDGEGQHGLSDQADHTQIAHTDEDMIFPDYMEVINDDESVNADAQSPELLIMDSRQMNFEGASLGPWPLDHLQHTFQSVGEHLGAGFPRQQNMRLDALEQPWLAVDLKRALEAWEITAGFSRIVMRTWRGHTTKPTSMVRALTTLGALATYTDEAWIAGGSAGVVLFDVDFTSPMDATAVGTGGAIRRSVNYGLTWSAVTSPVAQTWRCIADGWMAGDNGAVARQVDATTWVAVVPDATSHDYTCCAAEGLLVVAAGEDGAIAGESVIMISTNGGAAWTKYTLGTLIVQDVDVRGGVIWLATSDGMARSADAGATWTDALAGTSLLSCSISGDRVWFGLEDGVVGWRSSASVGSLTLGAVGALTSGDDIISVTFIDDDEGLVVSSTGYAAGTRDGATSWVVELADGDGLNGAHMTRWRHRIAVGTDIVRFKA